MEIGNLPEKEFGIMIVNIIHDLRKRMEAKIEKTQEMFTKDLEEIKNKQRWIIHQKEATAEQLRQKNG